MRNDGLSIDKSEHIKIQLQDGPIKECGVNGCQIDDVIAWCVDVLQQLNHTLPCRETSLSITKLEEASHWLNARTCDRLTRGVEGTNAK